MSDRLQKKDIVRRLAERTDTDEKLAETWLDAIRGDASMLLT